MTTPRVEPDRIPERGELVVNYQPQVDLGGGRVIAGVQALVRWRDPERGLVAPAELFGTAEDPCLVRRLGAWVLDEACRQLAAWRALGLGADGLTVSVDLSAHELAEDGLVARVAAILAEHGLSGEALMVAVGEPALRLGGEVPARLRALRALGVRVAIGDARALWSSRLPADALKLDRALVGDAQLVGAAVGLARSLGLQPIAEGVETQEQARALAALGVELAQGHAFSAPCSAPAVEALLAADARREVAADAQVRVFLCDDAPGLRALLRVSLERDGDLSVVGEAGDGAGLPEAVRAARADVVLLDLSMPNVDGLEALAELRATDERVAVIVLSGFDARRMEAQALALGADRYVEKAAAMREVAAAVREVAAARRGPQPLLEAIA
jgi:EAL domain-containing protein (putative c-di-GMP-specific phosphodiesterase class I)/CheY-like chemotaxis protein